MKLHKNGVVGYLLKRDVQKVNVSCTRPDTTTRRSTSETKTRRGCIHINAVQTPCKLPRNQISFWIPAHDTSRRFPALICANVRNAVDIGVARFVMHERGTRSAMRKYPRANRSPLAQTNVKRGRMRNKIPPSDQNFEKHK